MINFWTILQLPLWKQLNPLRPIPTPSKPGPSKLSASSRTSISYAVTPPPVSNPSGSAGLLTRSYTMPFSLTTIVEAVGEAFTAAEDVVQEFEVLKPYVVQLMDVAETAYAGAASAGQNKLAAVLAAAEAVAAKLGVTWSAGLSAAISAFIATAKAAYNAFVSITSGSAPVKPAA